MKIGFIGSGWRANTYFGIVKSLPEDFTISGVWCHSEKSVQNAPQPTYTDLDEFLTGDHDFIMMLIPRGENVRILEKVLAAGFPVLLETPPAGTLEDLLKVWELTQKYNGRVQVAEQYFLQPYHRAVDALIREGVIGEVSNVRISMMHEYHAFSVIQKYLGTQGKPCTVTAKNYIFPVVQTCGRGGRSDGEKHIVNDRRCQAVLDFGSGKIGYYDFSGEQYFNFFRSRHIQIQGDSGEIADYDVAYLTDDGRPGFSRIFREDLGIDSNLEGYRHFGMQFNGKTLYRNEIDARLNDDEIAMAGLLYGMREYINGGEPIYPLAWGLYDMYLTICVNKAASEGIPVTMEKMPWDQTE